MEKGELIEMMRLAYLAGISDTEDGRPAWCEQGSMERAEELIDDINSDSAQG